MSDPGYTSTEKTKILYEESLKDIRELTGRLETVASLVSEANRVADNDRKRVGTAQRVSSDVATAERQKSFTWAAGSMTIFGMALFGAGMALGSQAGLGVGFLAAIALGVGLVSGLVLCQVLIAGGQVLPASLGKHEQAKAKAQSVSDFVWTSDSFVRAAQEIRPAIDTRVLTACRNVLINKESALEAANKERLPTTQVQMSLNKFNKWRENN